MEPMKSDYNKQVITLTVITFCSFQCIKNLLIIDSLVVNFQLLPNCLKSVIIAILYGFKFVIAIGHFPSSQNCFNNNIWNYSLCQMPTVKFFFSCFMFFFYFHFMDFWRYFLWCLDGFIRKIIFVYSTLTMKLFISFLCCSFFQQVNNFICKRFCGTYLFSL